MTDEEFAKMMADERTCFAERMKEFDALSARTKEALLKAVTGQEAGETINQVINEYLTTIRDQYGRTFGKPAKGEPSGESPREPGRGEGG